MTAKDNMRHVAKYFSATIATLIVIYMAVYLFSMTAFAQYFFITTSANGNIGLLKIMLRINHHFLNCKTSQITPLIAAVANNRANVVEYLLNEGANPNIPSSPFKDYPLHIAAQRNYAHIAALLLEHGAYVEARSKPSSLTPLHDAATMDSIQCIKLLCSHKANIDARNIKGETPLFFAVRRNRIQAVRLLIGYGANVNDTNSLGQTPLHIVNDEKVALLLLEKGALIDKKDLGNRTPLYKQAGLGKKSIVELLISKGAALNVTDTNGKTALDNAATSDIKALLIAHGIRASVEAKDRQKH